MEKKNLTQATILIATFLLAIPIAPAGATTPASLFVSPSSIGADLGTSFTASVMVSGASMLVAYDFKVLYNPNVLTVVSTSLGHTAFDLNNNGIITDDPVLVARADVFQAIGVIRYAVVLLGGASVTPVGSASLLNIVFQVNAGVTASDYPSAINLDPSLIGFDSSGATVAIPTTTAGASFMLPADVGLRNVGCRAVNDGFNTLAKGFTDPIFCRVTNGGGQGIVSRADFSWRSVGGVVGSTSSDPMPLAAGQAAELDSSITVPNVNDIFIVTGTPTRLITFPDGSVLAIQGPSDVFKIVINVPLF